MLKSWLPCRRKPSHSSKLGSNCLEHLKAFCHQRPSRFQKKLQWHLGNFQVKIFCPIMQVTSLKCESRILRNIDPIELIINRFPFDEQYCNIELVFTEYDENEVSWLGNGTTNSTDKDPNPGWVMADSRIEFKPEYTLIQFGKDSVPIMKRKKKFKYILILNREPRTALVYVVIPTLAITFFNLISLLLPSGQGMLADIQLVKNSLLGVLRAC